MKGKKKKGKSIINPILNRIKKTVLNFKKDLTIR